jgi:hypothetical protein
VALAIILLLPADLVLLQLKVSQGNGWEGGSKKLKPGLSTYKGDCER